MAELELSNSGDETMVRRGFSQPGDVRREVVHAAIGARATMLAVPEDLAKRLGLATQYRRLARVADGSVIECDVVGPVGVRFGNRYCVGSAITVPGLANVILGSIQMDEMDLLVDPLTQRLIFNPRSPDRAMVFA